MAEVDTFLEQKMVLKLFREWLDTGVIQVDDPFMVSQNLEELTASFERPVRVALIGSDPVLVRRVVSLLLGGEQIEAKHYSEDFRPVVLSYNEAPEAALRWWDRPNELPFDGSRATVEAEQADIICLRGPYDMPHNLELIDMSGASLASPQLVTFAMKQICDQVVWVSWNKDLAATPADKIWKSVPAVLRKAGAVIACVENEDGSETLEVPPKLKTPLLDDVLLDLGSSEVAVENGTALPDNTEAIISSFIERFSKEHTQRLASEIKTLIVPHVGDSFWSGIEQKIKVELAVSREAEILQAATLAAANDDMQPTAELDLPLDEPGEPIELAEQVATDMPSEGTPEDLRQIWRQQLGDILGKGDTLSVEVLCDWGRVACTQILNAEDAPVDCKTDCRSAIAFMDSLETDNAEAARMDLISMFCQLANTIGEMTQPELRETPPDIVEMMTGTIAI